MSAYGDDEIILGMLGPSAAGFSGELEERVTAMNEVVSGLIEEKTGRVWLNTTPSSSTKTIYPTGGHSTVLPLPVPATAITAITVDGTDDGGVITAGTSLDASRWSVALRNSRNEITAIQSNIGAVWNGYRVVQITGTWAETQNATPDDISWAVNYIVAERIKQEQANPAGFVGPDGSVVPIRDPWADTQVKAIVRRHTLTPKGLVL